MIATLRTRAPSFTRFVLLIVVAAGVAFLVARETAPTSRPESAITPAPLVSADRATVQLTSHSIAPVLSGDGRVVMGTTPVGAMLEAPVTAADQAYRLLQPPVAIRALIDGGPAGFDCPWLGLGQSADGGVTMRCAIPADVPVAPGLTGEMVLQLSAPVDAPSLPVESVVGTADQGQVVVVAADGTTSARSVRIGRSDTFWVEVTDGLDPGEQVLLTPIEADFRSAPV